MSSTEGKSDGSTVSDNVQYSIAQPDLGDILGIVKRGWPTLALSLGLGLASGLALVAFMPPTYRANVRLVLENSINKYLQSNKVIDGPSLGDDSWSQLHIIASEPVVLPVIQKLNLKDDPELGSAAGSQEDRNLIRRAKDALKVVARSAGILSPAPGDAVSPELSTYRSMSERLSVTWESQPLVINVSFDSKDPAKAALIANEVAHSYINSTIDSKRKSARLAATALQKRLEEVRLQALNAERQAQDFRVTNNIMKFDTKAAATDLQGVTISKARVAMLDARDRLEIVQMADRISGGTGSISATENSFITKLREQYLDVETRAIEMENRLGKNHEVVRKLRKRMEEITANIASEHKRIASTYAVEYEVAKARLDEYAPSAPGSANDDAVVTQARELDNAAETLRTLYVAMLQRASEESKSEREPVVLPDARILAHAAVPTRTESSKRRMFILASSSALGLLLGLLGLIAFNNPIGVYRTPNQIRESLGLMPVVVPRIDRLPGQQDLRLQEYAGKNPHSRFAEAFRSIWTLIKTSEQEKRIKVVGIVSSVAQEGKSTTATNLAAVAAANTDGRTLIIDADLHRQSLSRAILPDAKEGLREAIANPERLPDLIVKLPNLGFDILPCSLSDRPANTAQLLGSHHMETLINKARESYDLILVDIPPIASISDGRMLSSVCDGFVYVVEWGRTSQRLVLETFSENPWLWSRNICVVLNNTQLESLKGIEAYKGSRYGYYYG